MPNNPKPIGSLVRLFLFTNPITDRFSEFGFTPELIRWLPPNRVSSSWSDSGERASAVGALCSGLVVSSSKSSEGSRECLWEGFLWSRSASKLSLPVVVVPTLLPPVVIRVEKGLESAASRASPELL